MAKVIVEKLSKSEIEKRGILTWPVWEKEVSYFPWEYDGDEECLILEGEFIVETDEGNFRVRAGDFVTFRHGLKCRWRITKAVRKHYNFK